MKVELPVRMNLNFIVKAGIYAYLRVFLTRIFNTSTSQFEYYYANKQQKMLFL